MLALTCLAVVAVFPFFSPPGYYLQVLLSIFTWATLASGWNIIGGYTGYISLGNSFAFGLGMYVAAILMRYFGLSPFLSAPIAGLLASVGGFAVGLVTLRAKGTTFIIVTLSTVLAANIAAQNLESITGGASGLSFPVLDLPARLYVWPFYYAMLFLLMLALATSHQVKRSKFGLGLVAIREDEERAASMGINTLAYKSLAFALSVFFSGAAGSVYAYYQAFVFPDGAFNFLIDVRMIIMTLLGGRGILLGPLLGAATIVPMTEFFNTFLGSTELNAVALGALLVFIIKFKPNGILGGKAIRLGGWGFIGMRGLSKPGSRQ